MGQYLFLIVICKERTAMHCQYLYIVNYTHKYLNFGLHHPVHVKQGVVKSLFDRARRVVTRESDLWEEEKHLRQVLLNNGENSRVRSVRPRDEEMSTYLVVIPYVSGY